MRQTPETTGNTGGKVVIFRRGTQQVSWLFKFQSKRGPGKAKAVGSCGFLYLFCIYMEMVAFENFGRLIIAIGLGSLAWVANE